MARSKTYPDAGTRGNAERSKCISGAIAISQGGSMGKLIAMHYPTSLAYGAADHTYVMCGTGGKAWGCWGGKMGGTPLGSGSGSTQRADRIAEPNEHGGITCYLINGVCHQAANRILIPAGISVAGARGYGLSSAIFGIYGRPKGPLGTCNAPLYQHAGVTGDLPECVETALTTPETKAVESSAEKQYIEHVAKAYSEVRGLESHSDLRDADLVEFMYQLFKLQIAYNLGNQLDGRRLGLLHEFRIMAERARIELETNFAERKIRASEFVANSDHLVISFQRDVAEVLNPDEYMALFDLKYGEFVALADPEIVANAYPQKELE